MIKFNSVTRCYGAFTAVDAVSFQIDQEEIVGLLGHNGAGKTTIMKMLTGYLEATAGEIRVDDLDIRDQQAAIQKKIGYLPENCPLYPEMTVMDYLDYAASLHGVAPAVRAARVNEAIFRTELESRALHLIGTLSRGYRQRVGVAQAILHHPRILVLDEPTNGLDPTQIQHMRRLIRELAQSATVILSTHILPEVQAICDRAIIIRAGRKVLDARLDELQSSRRLLLCSDAETAQLCSALRDVTTVTAVEPLQAEGARHRYALALDDGGQSPEAAPLIARTIVDKGFQLYALHPEQRDLETIFSEITA